MSQRHWLTQLHWRILALVALGLGMLGIPLPGLPTVPFVLLATWSAARGWPRLEHWLVYHPRFGRSIRLWREQRIVSRRAKYAATAMIAISLLLLWLSELPVTARMVITAIVLAVNIWLWRQNESDASSNL